MEPATLTAKVKAVGVEETIAKVTAAAKSIQGARAAGGRSGIGASVAGATESIRATQNAMRATDNATRETAEFTRQISEARRATEAWAKLHLFSPYRQMDMRGMGPGRAGFAINEAVERGRRGRTVIVPPIRRNDFARRARGFSVRAQRVARTIGPARSGVVGGVALAGVHTVMELFNEISRLDKNLADIPAIKGTITGISEFVKGAAKYAFPPTWGIEQLNNLMEGKPMNSGIWDRVNKTREAFGMDPVQHPAQEPQRRSSWEQIYNERYGRQWGR